MKVISIQELRENKLKKIEDQKVENVKLEEVQRPLDDVAYHFSLGWMDLNFGGAFVRDLIKNLDKNREVITQALRNNIELGKEHFANALDKEDPDYILIKKAMDEQDILIMNIINTLKTPHDLDAMFDDDSKYIHIIGFVIMVIMVYSYSQFDYHRMERDNWMKMSLTVEDLMASDVYKAIQSMV